MTFADRRGIAPRTLSLSASRQLRETPRGLSGSRPPEVAD